MPIAKDSQSLPGSSVQPALNAGDLLCWVKTRERGRGMSMVRREGVLVANLDSSLSQVRISKGKIIEVETKLLQPEDSDPLGSFISMLAGSGGAQ